VDKLSAHKDLQLIEKVRHVSPASGSQAVRFDSGYRNPPCLRCLTSACRVKDRCTAAAYIPAYLYAELRR